MPIKYDRGTKKFKVEGRVGFTDSTKHYVDRTTADLQNAPRIQGALGPVESAYNPALGHDAQGTMRAHHIADSQIQQMVCDYMNGTINLATLLDRLGVLYLTGWVDVVVTPRLFYIWRQYADSVKKTLNLALAKLRHLPPDDQATLATQLARTLSSSISNLRVGDQRTDSALSEAIAPRLQRGQWDLFGSFLGYVSRHNFAQPTLSVETSLAVAVWGNHFQVHTLPASLHPVNNVFAGTLPGGQILISEEHGSVAGAVATVATPNYYPGTQGGFGYVTRATRATMHLAAGSAIQATRGMMDSNAAGYVIRSTRATIHLAVIVAILFTLHTYSMLMEW
jgi:hypothetical protein